MEKKAGDEREKKKTGKQDETARKGKKERDREDLWKKSSNQLTRKEMSRKTSK